MDLGLQGKRALVTGSTAGIGFAIARRLAAEGAHVWLSGRTQARVDAAIASIRAEHPEARLDGIAADVGAREGIEAMLRAAPDLDILVNNAAVFNPLPFEETSDEEWLRHLEVNLMSGVRLSRHHFPRMLAAGEGRIIFISSESAVQIPAEMIHYGVTKTAQAALARGLAERTVGTRVTVNTVLPGPTRSEGVETFLDSLAQQQGVDTAAVERDFFNTARPSSLLRRFETPDEIADIVAFVASARAAVINGAAVRADGGVIRSVF
ncbi:SDR family NAD(P)-dependent oxidoreductase [Chondromyces apiculatus]|uniref:3-oxoacyl-[acyl-carrier protein] reductase n=1 Tax=Chondromyces apiculatus DSM 436 TaxID=1192034 RepID=A0A017T5T8_9BACT|nr:SDR family oxidoreductase [Chondromyces apiculatus]EYF04392.1 3-oxoacyl-[acyl-carrier protein] reductase [Chondromyces apiculatus DSM 436]